MLKIDCSTTNEPDLELKPKLNIPLICEKTEGSEE